MKLHILLLAITGPLFAHEISADSAVKCGTGCYYDPNPGNNQPPQTTALAMCGHYDGSAYTGTCWPQYAPNSYPPTEGTLYCPGDSHCANAK